MVGDCHSIELSGELPTLCISFKSRGRAVGPKLSRVLFRICCIAKVRRCTCAQEIRRLYSYWRSFNNPKGSTAMWLVSEGYAGFSTDAP